MKKAFHCCRVVCFLFLLCSPGAGRARAEGPAVSTSVGIEFASGDYGTGTRTESVYLPVTLTVAPTERVAFAVEIPYVYQSNSAVNTGVLLGSGGMRAGMRKTAAMSAPHMGGASGPMSSANPGNYGHSSSGVGDITAKAGYVLVREGEAIPTIRPYLFVKFPTGDQDRALGTGAFDEGVAVEFLKQFGDWYTFVETGYTFQGNSSRLPLKDYFSFEAGIGRALGEKLLPMLVVKAAGAPMAGTDERLETRLKLKYLATERTGLEAYLGKGWTDSSPDYGGGIAVSYDF